LWAGLSIQTLETATGKVVGKTDTGGLVGYANDSNIRDSYVTGTVSGAGYYTGGLVGSAYKSSVTNSYWDTSTTGQDKSAGGTGKSTEEMKRQETYKDWDFDEIWQIWQINDGIPYPTLR